MTPSVVDLELERLIRRLDKTHRDLAAAIEVADVPGAFRLHDDLMQVAQALDSRTLWQSGPEATAYPNHRLDARRTLFPSKAFGRRRSRLSRSCDGVHISVDFEAATDKALLTFFHDLAAAASSDAGPFFVEEKSQPPVRFANGTAALQYLVLRLKSAAPKRADFGRAEQPFNKAAEPFRVLTERCSAQKCLNTASIREMLISEFDNRYCVVVPEASRGQLILMEFGDGYQHIDGSYNSRSAGRPFGQFESRDYTAFVQDAYKDAWRKGRAVVEEITVPEHFEGNLPPSYKRIILPVQLATGPALLSATCASA